MDSGIGLLAAAAVLRRLRPDADLVLSSDPDGMPWGPRTPQDVTERALDCARAAAEHRPDALIVACNTASVHALPALRAALEPALPVIGTVPADQARRGRRRTGGRSGPPRPPPAAPTSARLIADFAAGVRGHRGALPRARRRRRSAPTTRAVDAAVAAAAALTPPDVRAVVLGCTHYELVADRIRAACGRPGARRRAVRLGRGRRRPGAAPDRRRTGPGRRRRPATSPSSSAGAPSALPAAALAYPEGRGLARGTPAATGRLSV